MNTSYLRVGVAALASALALSGCGGSSGNLLLGGYISGITKDSVTLQNNGAHDLVLTKSDISANGQFFFKDLIGVDEEYNVTVKPNSWPNNVEGCTVANGKGRAVFNVTTVVVTCTLITHSVGGTITGVPQDSKITVVNGTDKLDVTGTGADLPFTMQAKVGEDQAYGITVIAPAGLSCSVANGSKIMQKADVSDVVISCAKT
jgi:hypothetical protein